MASGDETKIDPFDRIDALPPPRTVASAVTEKAFFDRLKQFDMVTMNELEAAGALSRKTILKHIRQGLLIGQKEKVQGRLTWLFHPCAVETYLNHVTVELEKAVYAKANRPKPVTAAQGFTSIDELADLCGVSHWTIRKHLRETGVTAHLGPHHSKFVSDADIPALQTYFTDKGGPTFVPQTAQIAPADRIAEGPYFESFEVLNAVLISQPEITSAQLAQVTGCRDATARRWKAGARVPERKYRPALVRLFCQLFPCRLSSGLVNLRDDEAH